MSDALTQVQPRPAVAKVEIVLNGDVLRAHAVAATVPEAIDLMHDRLLTRMARVTAR